MSYAGQQPMQLALPTTPVRPPPVPASSTFHVQTPDQFYSRANPQPPQTPQSSQLQAQTGTGTRGPRKPQSFKGAFSKDLRTLMHAFGDDPNPAPDTVHVMEEILMEFLVNVCSDAIRPTRKNRIQLEDIRRALSRPGDEKKLSRVDELLFMQENIARARKQFQVDAGE